jgi:uncharacterized protein with HEPN domain
MSRDWRLFYFDLMDFCRQILDYTQGMDRATFEANRLVFDATLRNLELIGEAAKHIPENVRQLFPDIPWQDIVGARNIFAHAYFGVDRDLVWHTVKTEIPVMLTALHALRDEVMN